VTDVEGEGWGEGCMGMGEEIVGKIIKIPHETCRAAFTSPIQLPNFQSFIINRKMLSILYFLRCANKVQIQAESLIIIG
jgi:hypothetical protein